MSDVVPSRAVTGSADSILSSTSHRANCSAGGLAGLPTDGSTRARLAYSQPRLVSLSVGGATSFGGGASGDADNETLVSGGE
jgi:hypothetical protein